MPTLEPHEVLLKVNRVGLCGSDLNTYRGLNPLVSFPRIPGHEIAGTVVSIGEAVSKSLVPGQQVTLNPYRNCGYCPACLAGRINACSNNETMGVQREGALAEFIAVAHERIITTSLKDPNHIALIEPLAVGFHAASRADVKKDDIVAVFGCGIIGLSAIAGSVRHGATVIAVDLDDSKLELAETVGATDKINARKQNPVETIRALTDGYGTSVAIEAVGLDVTLINCVEAAAPVGRVVYIGYSDRPVTYDTTIILKKELDIRGSRGALQSDFKNAVKYIEGGALPVEHLVTKVFKFSDAGLALKQWSENPFAVTKFIIDLDSM